MHYCIEFITFVGLMMAQGFGAVASCAYAWHHVDRDEEVDRESGPPAVRPYAMRLGWHAG